MGFRKDATPADVAQALATAGTVQALATTEEKAEALSRLAEELGLPVHAVSVAGIQTPTQSKRVQDRFGTGSVAEAAALVAAGQGARLILTRQVVAGGRATVAVAEGRS